MTPKEKVIRMVERLADRDISYERLIFQVTLLKGIEIGRELIKHDGDGDFEEVCRRIECEWQQSDLAPPSLQEIEASMTHKKKAPKKSRKRIHSTSP